MIRVQLPNRVIGISFTHRRKRVEHHSGHHSNVHTVCELFEMTADAIIPLSIGFSYCSEHDNFCKETGRKLSLEQAIWELTPLIPDKLGKHDLSKSERRAIWNAYIHRPGKSRKERGKVVEG